MFLEEFRQWFLHLPWNQQGLVYEWTEEAGLRCENEKNRCMVWTTVSGTDLKNWDMVSIK
jgi:hypothetical protein